MAGEKKAEGKGVASVSVRGVSSRVSAREDGTTEHTPRSKRETRTEIRRVGFAGARRKWTFRGRTRRKGGVYAGTLN